MLGTREKKSSEILSSMKVADVSLSTLDASLSLAGNLC